MFPFATVCWKIAVGNNAGPASTGKCLSFVASWAFILSFAGCWANDRQLDVSPRAQRLSDDDISAAECIRNATSAITECTEAIKEATVAHRSLLRAVGAVKRVGDPTAVESVSYDFSIGGMHVTLTLDSSGWLSLYDSSHSMGIIRVFPDSKLQDALQTIRQVVEKIETDQNGVAQVRVVRHFYANAPGTVIYQNRLTKRVYTFECTTDDNVMGSSELDHLISLFYATGNW